MMGARPPEHAGERLSVGPIVDAFLGGQIAPGTVIVDADGERLSFAQEPSAEGSA